MPGGLEQVPTDAKSANVGPAAVGQAELQLWPHRCPARGRSRARATPDRARPGRRRARSPSHAATARGHSCHGRQRADRLGSRHPGAERRVAGSESVRSAVLADHVERRPRRPSGPRPSTCVRSTSRNGARWCLTPARMASPWTLVRADVDGAAAGRPIPGEPECGVVVERGQGPGRAEQGRRARSSSRRGPGDVLLRHGLDGDPRDAARAARRCCRRGACATWAAGSRASAPSDGSAAWCPRRAR